MSIGPKEDAWNKIAVFCDDCKKFEEIFLIRNSSTLFLILYYFSSCSALKVIDDKGVKRRFRTFNQQLELSPLFALFQ